ncbi:MAG: hypothetical protein VXZ82_09935 [Planctomycetota bacterium]|nr:hypothetical protein [Planctomycetota bacterium]
MSSNEVTDKLQLFRHKESLVASTAQPLVKQSHAARALSTEAILIILGQIAVTLPPVGWIDQLD